MKNWKPSVNVHFSVQFLRFYCDSDSVKQIGQDAFTNTDKQFIIQCSFWLLCRRICQKEQIQISAGIA